MEELTLTGLVRTSEEFVRDEIGFESGCEISLADAESAAQRLRNTNFFLSVSMFHERISDRAIRLHFVFEEKWTLTPVIRGGSGGGIQFLVLGLYDINAMGAGIESGVQYEQYAGAPGVSLWWRDPHVVTRDWKLSVDYQFASRPAFFLHPQSQVYYTPLARLHRLTLMGARRFGRFELGLGAEPVQRELMSSDFSAPAEFSNFSRTSVTGVTFKSVVRFNGVNLDDFRLDGIRTEAAAEFFFSERKLVKDEPVMRVSTSSTFYRSLAQRHTAAVRLQAATVSSGQLLDLLRLGSLDGVRGALDGERIGRAAWIGNVEYRYGSFVTPRIVLQNVAFADAGNSGESFGRWSLPPMVSAGTGLRLGFRPIARLRLRADYAVALKGLRQPRSWVVGMQQYF